MRTQIRLPFWTRRFAGDIRGVYADEFALRAAADVDDLSGRQGVSTGDQPSRKVTLVSRTLADLASQYTVISART